MNFPGRFDPKASDVSSVSLDSEHFTFAPNVSAAAQHDTGSGVIVVPDAHLLFSGDYKRAGNDLVLSSVDQKYVVHDYFKTEKRPTLVSQEGATLSGHIVSALTGHAQYAQANAPASGQVIGQVMKLSGSASAVRNGVAVELNIGDSVQKGDVIQTGSDSSIGLTLADGTVFGMTSNARMVLNEMIYDPNGSSNSSLVSLVQGTITFVAGQTAKNGNMRVETPVATMGIRGTAVLVEISANDGPTKFSVLLEPDGKTGSFNLYDKVTGQLLGTVSQAGQVTFVSPTGLNQPAIATEQQKTLADLQAEKALIQQVFQLYFPNYNPDDSKPNSTKTGPRTDIGVPENVIGKYAISPDTGRATITYTVPVTNPDTHQTTNVSIVYTNTPPTFSIANAEAIQSIVLGPNSFKLGDRVTITDPDIGTAPFFDVPIYYVANSGVLAQAVGPASAPGAFLVDSQLVSLNVGTGVVTYTPSAFKFLGDGETAVYRFTFIAASGVGGSGSDAYAQTLYLTVTGSNDAPVFAVSDTAPASFIEIANVTHPPIEANPDKLQSTIVLDFTDEDFSDTVFDVDITGVTVSAVGADPANVTPAQAMGFLTLTSVAKDQFGTYVGFTGATGKVTAAFSANDSVFDFLAEDEQIILTYTVRIEDGHGTFGTQTVTITVTGTNDTPVLVASGDTFGLNETTDATVVGNVSTLEVSGTIDFVDADLTDSHSTSKPTLATAVWLKPDGGGYISAGTILPATLSALADAAAATFNSDSTGGLTGQVGWNFALADSFVDFLAENETLTLIYDIVIDDGHTDAGTATQPITIVITGTNDAPTVDAPLTISTTEGNAPVVRDLLAGASDVDNGETATLTVANIKYAVNGGAQTTTTPDGITFPDARTINIDAAGLDHIASGATETIVVSYDVTDVHGATVAQTETITIAGVNDRPVLAAGIDLTTITEDEIANSGQTIASFATGISDADDNSLQGIAITGFTRTNGVWQFSTDDGASWTNFGTYAVSSALMLASDDKVRFVPDAENGSIDTLTYVAWDQTTGTHGQTANTMVPMDSAAFSQSSQTATLTVVDVNDAPVISSNGGNTTATISVAENTTAVTIVQATDVDGPNVTYEVVTGMGSPDAALFAINAATGELTFVAAPDYETPDSANNNNSYVVQVRATDGSLTDTQTLTVNVTDEFEGPTYLVSSAADTTAVGTLRSAIIFANNNPGTTIIFSNAIANSTITLDSELPLILGNNTTINGGTQNIAISGANIYRVFFIGDAGQNGIPATTAAISNLTIQDANATGGNGGDSGGGGGGGGGAGLGGAVFVSSTGSLTLSNVTLATNSATGGNGGNAFTNFVGGAGGGGMGGSGGGAYGTNRGGGGGGFGNSADGGQGSFGGAAGAFTDGDSGGTGPTGGSGGAYGGGGGSGGPNVGGGGGGVGGSDGFSGPGGGDGGFGGGGGGGYGGGGIGPTVVGGNGGYGGGGGSGGGSGDGGFGGGGGGGQLGGSGGFGGGAGSAGYGGGGGGGLGGAIFVMGGGNLTVVGTLQINGNDVEGGVGQGTGGTNGDAFGSGIFVAGSGTITFAPGASEIQDIANAIDDQSGSGGVGPEAGSWGLTLDGAGTLKLLAANNYTGATAVMAGTLIVTGSIVNSTTTVASGATLGGTGTLGDVIIESGGTIGGGPNYLFGGAGGEHLGILHTGDLTLNSGSLLIAQIEGNNPGVYSILGAIQGYDQVAVTGGVTLNDAVLNFTTTGGWTGVAGQSYTIIDNDGALDAIVGTFNGLVEGAQFGSGGFSYQISYVGGDGNDVVVTRVNMAPTITNVDLTISEGQTVVLSGEITTTDPDGVSNFTYTASNIQGGKFQTTANGVDWNDSNTFSTAQISAQFVRFVHDGSETPASFSIQANDGGAANNLSNIFDANVTYTPINNDPVIDLNGPLVGTGTTVNYNEGTVFLLAPTALFSDSPEPSSPGGLPYLPGGSVTIAVTQNASGAEVFGFDFSNTGGVISYGPGAGHLLYNNITFASFTGGANGDPLVISFRGVGTTPTYNGPLASEIEYLLQHLTFSLPDDGNPSTPPREVTFTATDGQGGTASAIATVNVQSTGNAPVAGDDFINVLNTYSGIKSTLTYNDIDPDDVSPAVSFAISGVQHPTGTETPVTGGFAVQGLYGTLYVYSVTTNEPIFNTVATAGDYVFAVGNDIVGNPIVSAEIDALHDLQPGQHLTDTFTYTITDTSNNTSAPATITMTLEAGPVFINVLTDAGYDITQLWDDLHFGTVTSHDSGHATVVYGGRQIEISGKNLVWDEMASPLTLGDLTGGLIKTFFVSDGSGNLFQATNYNISANAFGDAIIDANPMVLNAILQTYAYDATGGAGADFFLGGNFDPNSVARDDRIDTGGGADHVMTYAGNDLIVIHDNSEWQIDGGDGIDTIKLDGTFDLINGPATQYANSIEIFDLNKAYANTVAVEAEGVFQINGDHTVRFLGDSSDRVALVNNFTGHQAGHWGLVNTSVSYTGDFVTSGVVFDQYEFKDAGVTYATAYVEQGINVNVGVLGGNGVTTYEGMGGVTTVFDIFLNDSDQNAVYSVSALAEHGAVTTHGGFPLGSPVDASVQDINLEFQAGIVYSPNNNPPDTPDQFGQLNDKVTLTVTDSTGLSDTLNFVFRQQGNGPATLVGTNQKDILFSTENNDTLTGLSGRDNFVFANSSGQDTVTDFQVGIDHLVINDYVAPFIQGIEPTFANWINNSGEVQQIGNDTVIDLDPFNAGQNTIILQNVQKVSLSMNDFILHPSGGGGM